MKKKFIFIFLMILLILPINVFADTIKKLDMKIYLDNKGNADITEYWYVKASGGSEWYKAMYNLGLSEITDFKVSMDGTDLKQKESNNIDEITYTVKLRHLIILLRNLNQNPR